MIPEVYIWRAANLMLKRYGEKAIKAISLETTWKSMLARGAVEALNRNRKG